MGILQAPEYPRSAARVWPEPYTQGTALQPPGPNAAAAYDATTRQVLNDLTRTVQGHHQALLTGRLLG